MKKTATLTIGAWYQLPGDAPMQILSIAADGFVSAQTATGDKDAFYVWSHFAGKLVPCVAPKGFESPESRLQRAIELLRYMHWYAQIHPITGVVYPECGPHPDVIKKVDDFLSNEK